MNTSGLFPDPRGASSEGLVAVGGAMTASTLLEAYGKGIFPWPHPGYPWLWFSPPARGALFFQELHISRSLRKFRRQHPELHFTQNEAFAQVMRGCQKQKRPGQDGTWILDEMIEAYGELATQGHALSVEVWANSSREDLVAGIYGVKMPYYFSAESMFHKISNGSKLALWVLIERLQSQGIQWMDLQMVTPVTKSFGARLIEREEFLCLIHV